MSNNTTLDTLKQQFIRTYSGLNTVEVKNAEQAIRNLQSKEDFIQNLVQIILSEANENLQKSVSSYVSEYIRYIYRDKKQQGIEERAIELTQIITSIMGSSSVSLSSKKIIQKSLDLLLSIDIDLSKIELIFENLYHFIVQLKDSNVNVTLMIIQSASRASFIFRSKNVTYLKSTKKQFIEQNILLMKEIGSIYFNKINQQIQEMSQIITNENRTHIHQIAHQLQQDLTILKYWSKVLLPVIQNIDEKQENYSIAILRDDIVPNYLLAFININFNCNNQLKSCLISTTNFEMLNDQLNSFKTNLLTIISYLCSCQRFAYYNIFERIIPLALSSLHVFTLQSQQKLMHHLDDKKKSKLTFSLLRTCQIALYNEQQLTLLTQNSIQIIFDIIFPLLCYPESFYEKAEDYPEEFCDFEEESDNDFGFDSLQKSSGDFLKLYLIKYEQSFEQFISMIIETITFSFEHEHINGNHSNQIELIKDTTIFKTLTREKRIEICLYALCKLSQIEKKKEVLDKCVEEFIMKHKDILFNTQLNTIIKARFCLVLRFFVNDIFLNDSKSMMYLLEYLLMCSCDENNIVSISALNSLSKIFSKRHISQSILQNIDVVVNHLSKSITNSKIIQLPELVKIILEKYCHNLQQNSFSYCLEQLTNRVCSEIQKQTYHQKQNYMIVQECWNIIKHLSENQHIMQNHIDVFMKSTENLFSHLIKFDNSIIYHEEVILIVQQIILHMNDINQITGQFLSIFPQLIASKGNSKLGLLYFTYAVSLKHKRFFLENQIIVQNLIDCCYQCMISQSIKSSESDKAEAATLLILIQFALGNELNEVVLRGILQAAISTLQVLNLKVNSFLNGRVFNIINTAFLIDEAKTTQILTELGVIQEIVQFIQSHPTIFLTKFDVKLAIIGISKIFLVFLSHFEDIKIILTLIIQLQVKARKQWNAVQKIDRQISQIDWLPFSKIDEIHYFIETIESLRKLNQEQFLVEIEKLTPENKKYLQQIIQRQGIFTLTEQSTLSWF